MAKGKAEREQRYRLRLIKFVRSNPLLWNKNAKNYGNHKVCNEIWYKFENDIECTKKIWQLIRRNYVRIKKRELLNKNLGKLNKNKSKCYYYDSLTFLNDHINFKIDNKESESNYDSDANESESSYESDAKERKSSYDKERKSSYDKESSSENDISSSDDDSESSSENDISSSDDDSESPTISMDSRKSFSIKSSGNNKFKIQATLNHFEDDSQISVDLKPNVQRSSLKKDMREFIKQVVHKNLKVVSSDLVEYEKVKSSIMQTLTDSLYNIYNISKKYNE